MRSVQGDGTGLPAPMQSPVGDAGLVAGAIAVSPDDAGPRHTQAVQCIPRLHSQHSSGTCHLVRET